MFDFNRDIVLGVLWRRPWCLDALVCADGFKMSVQASATHYCSPRATGLNFYDSVEVGFPSERVEELMKYAESPEKPTETVYPWVPVEVVNAIVNAHGGLKINYLVEAMKEVEEFLGSGE